MGILKSNIRSAITSMWPLHTTLRVPSWASRFIHFSRNLSGAGFALLRDWSAAQAAEAFAQELAVFQELRALQIAGFVRTGMQGAETIPGDQPVQREQLFRSLGDVTSRKYPKDYQSER